MKIPEAIATFYFKFKESLNKDESFKRLIEILKEYGFLDESVNNLKPLNTKNTYEDGTCRIILTDDSDNSDFREHINELFGLLKENSNIKIVKIVLNKYTRDIFYNNVDFYPNYQNKEIQDMEDEDIVVVHVNPE